MIDTFAEHVRRTYPLASGLAQAGDRLNTQLTLNAHICHIYQDRLEQQDFTRTFLRDALKHKEAVVFIASRDDIDAWYSELQASGIDLPKSLRLGMIQA